MEKFGEKNELNPRELWKIWAKREIQNQNKTKKYRKRVQNSGRYDEWEELTAQSRTHSEICVFLMESWTLKKFQQNFSIQMNGFCRLSLS